MEILRPMLHWQVSPAWYFFALLWGAGNMVLFLLAKGVFTGNGFLEVSVNLSLIQRPDILLTIFLGSFIGEIVWISYAVRKLNEGFTLYSAALIVGVVWTMWWAPNVVLNVGIVPDLPFLALLINQTGVAAMAAFLYWHTKSGLVVLIGQIMFNASLLAFSVTPTAGGVVTYYAFAVSFFLATLLLYLVKGPKPLLGRQTETEQMIA